MKPHGTQRRRQLRSDKLAKVVRKGGPRPWLRNGECDKLICRGHDCHGILHRRRATQHPLELGRFDASTIDLYLAPLAADDPQQAMTVKLDEVTRREEPKIWVIRIRFHRHDGAVLPMAKQDIWASYHELSALTRLNAAPLFVDYREGDSWEQPANRNRGAFLRPVLRQEPLRPCGLG